MIKTETITIRDRQMARTYSDAGMMIERDGVRYSEAVDPIGSGRTYTETDEPVPEEPTLEERVSTLETSKADQTSVDELNEALNMILTGVTE